MNWLENYKTKINEFEFVSDKLLSELDIKDEITEEEFLSGKRLVIIGPLGFEWTIGKGSVDMIIHDKKEKLKNLKMKECICNKDVILKTNLFHKT